MDLQAWLTGCRESVDAFLETCLPRVWPEAFNEPLRYPLFGGGKRIRPALALGAYEALAERPEDRAPVLPPAGAVELVHTYSLVHDDLPCMDDDAERRGRPTVHVRWGEAAAVLVGDALLTEAFGVVARSPVPARTALNMVRRLSSAAGAAGMVGGQAADIGMGGARDRPNDLARLHRQKTGALIECAVVLGGLAAGAEPWALERLERYGASVGLAFQLADDLLDADEDADGAPTFVKVLGRRGTLDRARELAEEAVGAVAELPRPQALQLLARFVIDRDV